MEDDLSCVAEEFLLHVYQRSLFCDTQVVLRKVFESWKLDVWRKTCPRFEQVLFLLRRKGAVKVRGGGELEWLLERTDNDLLEWLRSHDLEELGQKLWGVCLETVLRFGENDLDVVSLRGARFSSMKRFEKAIRSTNEQRRESKVRVGRMGYDPTRLLGRGSSGTAVFVGSFDGRTVAIKRMDKDLWNFADNEVVALQKSQADETRHLVTYFGMEQNESHLFLATTLCATTLANCISGEGNIVCEIERIDERIRILHELAHGILHLHGLGVVHRDLTPSNVLLDMKGVVKISDMGLARSLGPKGEVSTTTSQGTCGWVPVEVLQKGKQSEKVDVFSFGCIAFHVMTLGSHPFGIPQERASRISKDQADLYALHMLQGVLVCRSHMKRKFNSKVAIQQHFDNVEGHETASFLELRHCLVCFKDFDEREHHDCEMNPSTMFAAEDLVKRCIVRDPQARLAATNIINHPLFWGPDRRLTFLQRVSDWLKVNDAVRAKIDGTPHRVFGSRGWKCERDVEVLCAGRYDNNALSGLVRLVRNVTHHLMDQFLQFKCLGDVATFFEERFPQLLMHIYCSMFDATQRLDSRDLAEFFPK